jgi:hypothetical protein
MESLEVPDRLRFAMSIMQYNQTMVNFTDGKANSLLLINSIFLATGAQWNLSAILPLAGVVLAACAILLSITVIYARMPGQIRHDRAKLVFFAHIRQRRNRAAYLEDFDTASAAEIIESLLKQNYDLAGVVDRKFRAYRHAQLATVCSAALWIANLLSPLLEKVN